MRPVKIVCDPSSRTLQAEQTSSVTYFAVFEVFD